MKRETVLDIVSFLVVIGAVLFSLYIQIKETGEISIRRLLMNSHSSVMNMEYSHGWSASQTCFPTGG